MTKSQRNQWSRVLRIARGVALILATGTPLLSSCSRSDRNGEIKVIETRSTTREERSKLIDEARHRLDLADQRLTELEHQLETESPEQRTVIEVRVKTLRSDRDSLQQKFDRLGDAAAETWNSIWQDVQQALDDLDAKLRVEKK